MTYEMDSTGSSHPRHTTPGKLPVLLPPDRRWPFPVLDWGPLVAPAA